MLIDTNILLSSVLMQNDYQNSIKLIETIREVNFKAYVSSFALYSICIELHKRNETETMKDFFKRFDTYYNFKIYQTNNEDKIAISALKLNLDFDDKLHYYIAKKKNLTLVSYDTHFDKTDLKRLTPKQALAELNLA